MPGSEKIKALKAQFRAFDSTGAVDQFFSDSADTFFAAPRADAIPVEDGGEAPERQATQPYENFTTPEARKRVYAYETFISEEERASLEAEYKSLWATLKKRLTQDGLTVEERKLYHCEFYFWCMMLHYLHAAYSGPNSSKACEYADKAEKIKVWLGREAGAAAEQPETPKQVLGLDVGKMQDDFWDLLGTASSSTKTKDRLGLLHLMRIYLTFSRLVAVGGVAFMQNMNWVPYIENLFKHPINPKLLELPISTFNFLSVAVLATRLLVNTGLILKHVFNPTDEEAAANPSAQARWWVEWDKRHPDLLNDIFWAPANLLANYAAYWHIPGVAGSAIMSTFLFFDLYMTCRGRNTVVRRYHEKREELGDEVARQQGLEAVDERQIQFLNEQIAALDESFAIDDATTNLKVVAATTTASSFALIFVVPAAYSSVIFFGVLVGFALYLSLDHYAKYGKLQWQKTQDPDNLELSGKINQARNDFVWNVVESATVPAFLMAAFTVSWPLALTASIGYMAYKMTHPYHASDDNAPAGAGPGGGEADDNAAAPAPVPVGASGGASTNGGMPGDDGGEDEDADLLPLFDDADDEEADDAAAAAPGGGSAVNGGMPGGESDGDDGEEEDVDMLTLLFAQEDGEETDGAAAAALGGGSAANGGMPGGDASGSKPGGASGSLPPDFLAFLGDAGDDDADKNLASVAV